MYRLIAIFSLLAMLTASAIGADCPIESMAPSEVEKLIVAAPTCERGLTIFESCGMGGMSDVILGGVVIEKCEAVFEGKLSATERRSYDRRKRPATGSMRERPGPSTVLSQPSARPQRPDVWRSSFRKQQCLRRSRLRA